MRTVDTHIINPQNDTLRISVTDEPGSGGANHRYEVNGFLSEDNPSDRPEGGELVILFQNGPIGEYGVNGITQEVLLAVVIDRLESFQKGEFACVANAMALQHANEALHWLQQRTISRMRRNV